VAAFRFQWCEGVSAGVGGGERLGDFVIAAERAKMIVEQASIKNKY